jgi:Tfp pilus assembly protein PilF
LTASRPDDAIALLQVNLEFNPQSARTYAAIAYAYTRKLDDAAAMTNLEKALEIEPENGVVRGQLEQLKSYHRKK